MQIPIRIHWSISIRIIRIIFVPTQVSGFALFYLLLFFIFNCSAQSNLRSYLSDPLLSVRERVVDFQHLKLEVSFVPQKGLVKGKVTHYFTPLRQKVDSIVLDGINMDIKEITLSGKPAKFRSDSANIIIYTRWSGFEIPTSQDSISITYEATPRKGLYFIGWNDKTGVCRKQIWSQGQGIDNRHWIPMYDEMNDKIISETFITFDTAYRVLSNGNLLEKKNHADGTFTWHYKISHPHAPYLIMLCIGKYGIEERKSASGVPLHLYYYPEWKNRIEATYKFSEQIMDFFEKEIGVPFPWESYSQIPVQDFMYGAMENTTATLFGDFLFVDERAFVERNYIGTNAHELAHQWFGDFITARSDAHHWLQESFATYYGWLWEQHAFGKNYFDWTRRIAQNNSLEESTKNKFPIAHSQAGSVRHYPKGAFVLSMLKNVLGGREVYNKCIKHYLEKHPYGNTDTHDLLVACEEVTGMSLDWFFEQWVYKGGEPSYHVSFRNITENTLVAQNRYAEFIVQQVQIPSDITGLSGRSGNKINSVSAHDPFVKETNDSLTSPSGLWKMPTWFEVYYSDGSSDKKLVWIEKQTEIIRLPVPAEKKTDFVLFDPGNTVLKSVSFVKPFEMLKAQALKAENMLDRYDALIAMQKINIERKRDFLISFYNSEKANFHILKAEVIKQLLQDASKKSLEIIRQALKDPDVQVRKAVLDNLKSMHEDLLPDVEKLLKDPSYEIIVTVLDYLSFANPAQINFYLEQTKDVEGMPGRNVKIKWLEIASIFNEKYIDQLVSYASNAYEFRTRANAITSLKKLNYLDATAIEYFIDALLSPNPRLSNPASDVLKFFYEQLRYKRHIINYVESREWEPWQRKIIYRVVK